MNVEHLNLSLSSLSTLFPQISVAKVAMNSPEEREKEINLAAEMADIFLRSRMDTVIMTSRELISGKSWWSRTLYSFIFLIVWVMTCSFLCLLFWVKQGRGFVWEISITFPSIYVSVHIPVICSKISQLFFIHSVQGHHLSECNNICICRQYDTLWSVPFVQASSFYCSVILPCRLWSLPLICPATNSDFRETQIFSTPQLHPHKAVKFLQWMPMWLVLVLILLSWSHN